MSKWCLVLATCCFYPVLVLFVIYISMRSVFVPPAPSGQVQNLRVEQEGLNVYLSWKNVLEQQQQGFIKGYNVSYSRVGDETLNSFGK